VNYTRLEFETLKKSFLKECRVKILSSSMEPFIYKNDVITLVPMNIEKIKKGDVIVYWRDNILICHLFYKLKFEDQKTLLITKGINSKGFDKPFDKHFYLGKVIEPKVSLLKFLFFKIYFFLNPYSPL
jgi:signal peptidase I